MKKSIKSQKQSYKGLQSSIRNLQTPLIDTFENIYSDKYYEINLVFPEFTSLCPKTGLPDFGAIYVNYAPDKRCIELKSLKEYFFFYRDIGIFQENAVNKILEDFINACCPKWVQVTGEFNIRGGIKTIVKAEYKKTRG